MMHHEKSGRKKARAMLTRAGYAAGGHVKGHSDEAEDKALIRREVKKKALKHPLKDGGCAEGGNPRPRADRLARGGKAKGHKKGHTTVNVVVGGQHPTPVPVPKPVPVPVPAGPGPMAGPGPGSGPMPPPGAGAPPPMGLKRGGRAKMHKRQKAADGGILKSALIGGGLDLAKKALPIAMMALKKGGKASSQREKINGMPDGHFAKGGRTKGYPITDGAGGGEGRLEKIKGYGAKPV